MDSSETDGFSQRQYEVDLRVNDLKNRCVRLVQESSEDEEEDTIATLIQGITPSKESAFTQRARSVDELDSGSKQ